MPNNTLVQILLFVVGVINFLPVIGIVSAATLSRSYDVAIEDNNLEILMRHRALLFGVLGAFILSSVFLPVYQSAAMLMAAVAMTGYLVILGLVGGYNSALLKVAWIDVVGLLCLLVAMLLYMQAARTGGV